MFSCQFYLLFLIKYLQTIPPCSLASWGGSLKETVNFLLYSIGWLDALWRKNWYESTEVKTAILLPSTVACCYMLLLFINWFYSFVWSNATEWILEIHYTEWSSVRTTQTVKQCSGAQELAFLAVFSLYPCSRHQRSAFYCSFEALSAPAMASSHYKIQRNQWEDPTLLQAKHGFQEGLR